MEVSEINKFLSVSILLNGYGDGNGNGNGDGDGNGNGYGYGNGDGDGNGNGYGYGNGNGNGYGYGYGDGNEYGYGVKSFNKQNVYLIDNVQTLITSIKNNVAKGFILNNDLTLTSCYIVKNNHYFAHGNTLKEALKSLEEKTLLNLPIEKRIESFNNTFKNYKLKVKAILLYDWHFKLTGSCKMGRDSFIQNKDINLTKDKFTIYEFIELTKDSYGSNIIRQLKQN